MDVGLYMGSLCNIPSLEVVNIRRVSVDQHAEARRQRAFQGHFPTGRLSEAGACPSKLQSHTDLITNRGLPLSRQH